MPALLHMAGLVGARGTNDNDLAMARHAGAITAIVWLYH